MSPEQVRGLPAGPESDLFSLGCVLYETISGRRAFAGNSVAETMSSILRDAPPEPISSHSGAPPELNRLILRCIEKNPTERIRSAHDLASQLKALLSAPAVAPSSGAIDSIAVLPFAHAGNDPDSEYLSEGLTESILNSLAKISKLRVTPRSTVFRYKSSEADPQTIGRGLNVRAVLTGRVMLRGDNLIVSAELMDVARGTLLWGERYHRRFADVFALEEEIARRIFENLRLKLTSAEEKGLLKRGTDNPEAYQLYLRGRHHWSQRTPDQLKKGVEYFQKAIEEDPGYALAYAGLADCYSLLGAYSIVPVTDGFKRAKAAAVAAVAFDEESAEGHAALGFIRAYGDCDWAGAEKEFLRAIELNPGYWVGPYWYGMMLGTLNRLDEADEWVGRAIELEPLSPVPRQHSACIAYLRGDFPEAVIRCKSGLESNPHYFLLKLWLGLSYQAQLNYREAIDELRSAVDLSGGAISWVRAALGHAYAVTGARDNAIAILNELVERADRGCVDPYALAQIYLGLGDTEKALSFIEQAAEAGGIFRFWAGADPRLDPLLGTPRFQAVLKRMNLAS